MAVGCWLGLEEAAEENGGMRIAHTFYAVNDKQAKARATLLFMEAFPDADDSQFEFRMYVAAEGIPRPAKEWDETFLFDNKWDYVLGHPVANIQASPVDFYKLQPSVRAAVLVKYGTTEITSDQLGDAIELQQGDSSTFDSHITDAISKTPAVASMHPERILEAIQYIRVNCTPNMKWPEIKAVLAGWLKSHEKERKEGAIDAIDTDAAGPSSVVVPRPYKHTYETLDVEIASALWAGDVDPNGPQPSVTRWANGIIKDDREDFKRWSIQLRTQANILKYDRPTIFGVVRNVPAADTYRFPESHKRYITEYLKAHGKMENEDDETEQNTAASTGPLESESPETSTVAPQHSDDASATGTVETAPPVERTGPFYYRTADGQPGRANKLAKLEAVIEQGCIEITKEEYQALKEAPPVQQQTSSDQPGINNLGNGRFSIEEMAPEQPQTDEKNASNEVEKTENDTEETLPRQPSADFQSVGDSLEKELSEKPATAQDNLNIWRNVMRTDPRFTKRLSGTGFEGNSINAEYMVMRATELFGPIGSRWGFEILEDRMLPGAPLSEAIYEDKKFICNRMLRDADGTLLFEQNHSIKIRLWYQTETDGGSVYSYGATPYLYRTKHGLKCDGEAQKKSLTDAIKKGLSLLGFSADVWLGLYDQPEYQEENRTEFAIKNASDKAGDTIRLRKELDERIERNLETIRSAVIPNEAKGVYSTITREIDVYRKDAQAKEDNEFDAYLKKRLLVLHRAVEQKVSELENITKQEQSA